MDSETMTDNWTNQQTVKRQSATNYEVMKVSEECFIVVIRNILISGVNATITASFTSYLKACDFVESEHGTRFKFKQIIC